MLRNKILVSVIIFMSCQIAFSNDNSLSVYHPGFYIGARGGLGWVNDGNDPDYFMDKVYDLNRPPKSKDYHQDRFGGGFLIGYSFSPYFSLQAATTFYPGKKMEVSGGNGGAYIEYKNSPVFSFGSKGVLPLEHLSTALTGWNLFGSLGPVFGFTSKDQLVLERSGAVYTLTSDKSRVKLGLLYELGIGYNFDDHWGVELSYSDIYSWNKSECTYNSMSGNYYFKSGLPSRGLLAFGIFYKI